MGKKRVWRSAEFKGKVDIEALRGLKTVNEMASQYQIHPTQIIQWKRQVQGRVNELFLTGPGKGQQKPEVVQAKPYEEVGRLKMELDWIKNCRALG